MNNSKGSAPGKALSSNRGMTGEAVSKLLSISIMGAVACLATTAGAGGVNGHNEIVFTDSSATVLRTDTASSTRPVVVTSQNKLMQPFGIAVGRSGELYVSDTGCLGLLGVNPSSGDQRLIACGGNLGVPFGIAVEQSGMILVANGSALVRVNPDTGDQKVVASGGLFKAPIAVAVAESGNVFVVDALGAIIAVNPETGLQTLISRGKYLRRPQGIAVSGNSIYVTDIATADMNFGIGRIVQVNAINGSQHVLAEAGNLVGPVGIAVDPDGDLIVGDPYTINPDSADLFDGAIIRINKGSGAQKLIARGSEEFVNPRCVVVIPSAEVGN